MLYGIIKEQAEQKVTITKQQALITQQKAFITHMLAASLLQIYQMNSTSNVSQLPSHVHGPALI